MDINQQNKNSVGCKIILVGDSGVGKTSIIARYVRKYKDNEKMTVGASFISKQENIKDNIICFNIWDTAGQEQFRSINGIFYQDAYICILVFDITRKQSFYNLESYWYNSVLEQSTKNTIFHIAGNKLDLFQQEEINREEVEEFGKKINAEISYISAKNENAKDVDLLFKQMAEKFLESDFYKENIYSEKIVKKTTLKLDKQTESVDRKTKNQKRCC